MDTTDILIVGGGAVGCTLATGLLQSTDYSVCLVDANALAQDNLSTPGFDARVIALARRTVDALSDMGIELNSTACPSTPIEHIVVSDRGFLGKTHLHASEHQLDSFGQVVSIQTLGAQVLPKPQARFQLIDEVTVTNATQTNDAVIVALSNGQQMKTRLLVLADGGRSPVAGSLGFSRSQRDYGQTAIITNIEMSQPHLNWAHERFTEHGPLALLPFATAPGSNDSGAGYSVVWTLPHAEADKALLWDDNTFTDRLQQAIGYRHGYIVKTGERAAYPLSLQQTDDCVRHRTVVVGNGAQALHPIAGQGFNLGLRDVIDLVAVLKTQVDPGAFSVLNQYRTQREADKLATIGLTDGLVTVFSNHYWPLVVGRNIGLLAMDYCQSLATHFVRQTTGFGPATRPFRH